MATKKSPTRISINPSEVTPESAFFFEFTKVCDAVIGTTNDVSDPSCKLMLVIEWRDRDHRSETFNKYHNIKEVRRKTKKILGAILVDISNDKIYHMKKARSPGPVQEISPTNCDWLYSTFGEENCGPITHSIRPEALANRLVEVDCISDEFKKMILVKAKQSLAFIKIIGELNR